MRFWRCKIVKIFRLRRALTPQLSLILYKTKFVTRNPPPSTHAKKNAHDENDLKRSKTSQNQVFLPAAGEFFLVSDGVF